MNTPTIAVIVSLVFSISLFAGEPIKLDSIIGKHELCISDGSSIYVFSPDKTFRLEPIGLSGRTIKGTWSINSEGLHIVGQWSWINGPSENNDFREMDIHIGTLLDNTRDHTSVHNASKYTIHESYFLIERLERKKNVKDVE